jgi:arylsulfatase A-like enzyme
MTKPNILLIILDTTRRDHLSAYGYDRPTSPHFDAFAASGATYTRAIAPAQWTIPAHASIFSGVYPGAHGVTQANSALGGQHPTAAEILHADGYRTAAFCNNPLVGVLYNGLQRGFSEFYNYASAIPQRPPGAQSPTTQAIIQRVQPHARRIANIFARSDTLFRLALTPRLTPFWSKAIRFKGSTDDSIRDLIDWLDVRRRDPEPYFAFLNLMGAHLPYHPPTDALERVAPELKADKRAFAFIGQLNADAAGWASPPREPYTDWQRAALHGFYDAEIEYQDRAVGRLLAHLGRIGALSDTLVIIAADHGEAHGDHELFGHGFNVHQELVHVPLAIHDPDGIGRGTRIDTNVSTRRVFHTILARAGVVPPLADSDPNADIARLTLTQPESEPFAFSEAIPPQTFLNVLQHRDRAGIARLLLDRTRRGVYAGDHKLIARTDATGTHIEGVYDVARDPAEVTNLSAPSPASPAGGEIETLRRSLDAFIASAGMTPHTDAPPASPEVLERLRALGYIE